MKIEDYTYQDWLRWMEACPEGTIFYVDDKIIETIALLLEQQARFTQSYPHCFEVSFRAMSPGGGVTLRRKSVLVAEAKERGVVEGQADR